MNKLKFGIIATIATLIFSTTAQATVVLPGGIESLGGDTEVTAPNTNGVVQNDNLVEFLFEITSLTGVGGDVQNRVVLSDNLNTMVFGPRIRDTFNIATTSFEILGFQLTGYAGWDTDVGYRTDSLGDKGPNLVSRSVDGDLLTFRYDDPLFISGIAPGPQEESLFPYIVTDALNYALTGTMTIFGRDIDTDTLMSVSIGGIAVPSAVPVPAAAWLFGSGLMGLVAVARRKLSA